MIRFLTLLLCAACALAGQLAYANGDGDNHQNGSVHHNTTNVTNEGDVVTTTNQGGQGGVGNGGQGGEGGEGGEAGASASSSYTGYSSASSAAALYLVGCQAGASAQGMGFGGAIGGESRECRLLRVAAALQAMAASHREFPSMFYEAARLEREAAAMVREAVAEVNGGSETPGAFTRASQYLGHRVHDLLGWIPVLRRIL